MITSSWIHIELNTSVVIIFVIMTTDYCHYFCVKFYISWLDRGKLGMIDSNCLEYIKIYIPFYIHISKFIHQNPNIPMKSQYIYQNIFNIYWKIILDTSKTFKVNFFSEFGWYLNTWINVARVWTAIQIHEWTLCCKTWYMNQNTRMKCFFLSVKNWK